MEWQAIKRATETARYELHNGNDASNPHTPAPLESDCREYIEIISILLTTLGYSILELLKEGGTEARARPTTEGLLVLAGSVGRATARPSLSAFLLRRRENLIEQGIVEVRDNDFVFLKDQLFNSPSTAGAVILGGSINGRTTWKSATGQTIQQTVIRAGTHFNVPALITPGQKGKPTGLRQPADVTCSQMITAGCLLLSAE